MFAQFNNERGIVLTDTRRPQVSLTTLRRRQRAAATMAARRFADRIKDFA